MLLPPIYSLSPIGIFLSGSFVALLLNLLFVQFMKTLKKTTDSMMATAFITEVSSLLRQANSRIAPLREVKEQAKILCSAISDPQQLNELQTAPQLCYNALGHFRFGLGHSYLAYIPAGANLAYIHSGLSFLSLQMHEVQEMLREAGEDVPIADQLKKAFRDIRDALLLDRHEVVVSDAFLSRIDIHTCSHSGFVVDEIARIAADHVPVYYAQLIVYAYIFLYRYSCLD